MLPYSEFQCSEFRLYSTSELEKIKAAIQQATARWLKLFGCSTVDEGVLSQLCIEIEVVDREPDLQGKWLLSSCTLEKYPALYQSEQLSLLLARICFGIAETAMSLAGSPLAEALLPIALNRWIALLTGESLIGEQQQPAYTGQPVQGKDLPLCYFAQGAIKVAIGWLGYSLKLLFSVTQIKQLLPLAPSSTLSPLPPYSLLQLADTRLACTVQSAGTRFAVKELTSLQCGDVIILNHKINEPLYLYAADGSEIGRVQYGVHNNSRAVQVVA